MAYSYIVKGNMLLYKEAVCQVPHFGTNFPKEDSILSNQERIFKSSKQTEIKFKFGNPRTAFGLIQCSSVQETQRICVMRTSQKQK